MADNRSIRQELYDRIRESSKDSVVLEEMKRMGFWATNENGPTIPELLIKKEAELNKELNKLYDEKRKYQNKEAVLREMRLKRMADTRLKREENKKKKELKRLEKAEAWKKQKETEIIYLGEGVSVGLNDTENNVALLQKHGLPVFNNENDLAQALGIPLKELRFLSFSRKVSTISHYRKFYIPKKSGGKRLISAPMPRLKNVQYWILENIFNKVAIHSAVHGFALQRSIISNAQPHIGKAVVVNIDVKDFFPSIHYKRVKGLLQQLGFSEKIAVILALLCTEAVTEEVTIDGQNYFVQKGQRVLPQGAPTSPAITNILCYKLDKRLQGLATKNQCSFTRYADDITFSFNNPTTNAQQLVWRIKKVLADEGFTVHPDKIRIMRKGAHQEVTGIVVNEKAGIPRKKLRQFRAVLHQLKTKEAGELKWGNGNLASAITGYANFVKMVKPAQGAAFQQQIVALLQTNRLQYPVSITTSTPTNKQTPPTQNNSNEPKKDDDKPWWNVV
ncbi:RNA-dependent DNA polymerase [Niastella yeongjuensis]|uniref:RNA-directed DNA polymerase n=1 Tax=Niastella yeongjuensis TaxID=354355 RepID=A0A1V9ET66_9BACT|nr:reverse transcriptase family protein [Niastella yeongjuensis]OQP49340.1 RNA-dependent DNA polymerase [Niastella yeongjuensis]SEP43420.1 RNA-directed DNA polymerase [Niastella yeongjuensis]